VKALNIEAIKSAIKSLSFVVDTEMNITLPDRLENFGIHWEKGESEGGAMGDPVRYFNWSAFSGVSTTTKRTDTAFAQATIRPTFSYTLRRGYRGPAKAKEHIIFVENPSSFNSSSYGSAWPTWQENGGTIVMTGQSKSIRKTIKTVSSSSISPGPGSQPNNTTGNITLEDSTSGDISYHIAQIPPCLHSQITGSGSSHSASATRGGASVSVSVNGTVNGTIPATSPSSISGDNYVVSTSHTPYKYGLWKVSIVTVDITPYI
jgi:hypothetical protein